MTQLGIHLWEGIFPYYPYPKAKDEILQSMHDIIDRARREGKIKKIVGQPKFFERETTVPPYKEVLVTFEFIMGDKFDMKKASSSIIQ